MYAEVVNGSKAVLHMILQQFCRMMQSIYVIQFVCLFAFGANTTEQNATKLSGCMAPEVSSTGWNRSSCSA